MAESGARRTEVRNSHTTFDFDTIIDRRQTQSLKWKVYDDDVLPM